MAKPKVSVIIPVYNVEPYLRHCVDSVLAQTFTDIEIILVDDGSTDRCPIICDEYAKKNERIQVIHKENVGLSSARNAGLGAAAGEYIAFVDSDDFIAPEMYQRMLDALQEANADLSVCGYQKVSKSYQTEGVACTYPFEILTGMQALEKMYTHDYIYFTIACNKLFKRSMFDSIRFPEGKLFEDGYAAFRYYYASKTVICLPDCFYFYLTRSNSITTSSLSVKNLDGLDADLDSLHFLLDKGLNELVEKAQTKLVAGIINYLRKFDLRQKDIAKSFRVIRKNFVPFHPGIIKNRVLSNKEKLLITSFVISPHLCKLIIKVKKL